MKLTKIELHTKILIGLILGAVAGGLAGESITFIKPVGTVFIRLITMIVVPLVFASLLSGTASLNDIRKLSRIGGKTIGFFLITTTLALTIGVTLANIVKPGNYLPEETQSQLFENYQEQAASKITEVLEKPSVSDILIDMIPVNPISALANQNMLQIIFFALMLGIALTMLPKEKSEPVIRFFDGVNDAMIRLVHIVMELAPYGVFALIAAMIGEFGLSILGTLISYSLVVLIGLLLHLTLVYSMAIRIFTTVPVLRFLRGLRDAHLIAFSSSSSSATLPVTMECAEENIGVSKQVSSFVLPLGATINMDGTALYQGVAAVFIAQVYGLDLSVSQQLMVILTATLASIGTAGVPGVGMIMLAMVLKSIDVPLEGVALILGVDRILDMCRTVVNITGDASCATVVAATEGELQTPVLTK